MRNKRFIILSTAIHTWCIFIEHGLSLFSWALRHKWRTGPQRTPLNNELIKTKVIIIYRTHINWNVPTRTQCVCECVSVAHVCTRIWRLFCCCCSTRMDTLFIERWTNRKINNCYLICIFHSLGAHSLGPTVCVPDFYTRSENNNNA